MIPNRDKEDLFDDVSKTPLELKADALQLDKLGLTYGSIEICYLEDLKFSKFAILTETTLYLSPAQYNLLIGYYQESKFSCVKFIDGLTLNKCSDADDVLGIAEMLVSNSLNKKSHP